MAETTEQIVREAPQVEAYKLGLLSSAKQLADRGIQIPQQMVAEMSALQVKGTDLTELGIGGYQPYLAEAGYTLGDAQNTIGELQTGVTTTGEGDGQVSQFDNPFLRDARRLMLNTTGEEGIPSVIADSNAAVALAQQKANDANLLSQNTDAREIQRFQLNEATEAGRTTADNAAFGGVGAYQTAADDLPPRLGLLPDRPERMPERLPGLITRVPSVLLWARMKMKQFKELWPTLDGPGTYNNKRSALKR